MRSTNAFWLWTPIVGNCPGIHYIAMMELYHNALEWQR